MRVAPSRGRGSKRILAHGPMSLRSRPLTGARIETTNILLDGVRLLVAPSRGRGSKRITALTTCANLCRPLTGARIETLVRSHYARHWQVAPSRGRGSKRHSRVAGTPRWSSPPHGGADRNPSAALKPIPEHGRPLTGARIETSFAAMHSAELLSPPHGGADRNSPHGRGTTPGQRRPLTGARIETLCHPAPRLLPQVAPSRGRGSKQRVP